MSEVRRVVKIFLASPGDLAAERKSVKTAIDELNVLLADSHLGDANGYQLELVGWEDTVSVYGRPQATINRELDRCEYFIGLLWKKWGTAPDTKGSYTSGFEEEFSRSKERKEKNGLPEMSLYFKSIDPQFLADPGVDLQRVLTFQKTLVSEKKILYDTFSDARELEKKIRRCIWVYVQQLRSLDEAEVDEKSKSPVEAGQKPLIDEKTRLPLASTSHGAHFLDEFVAKLKSADGQKSLSPSEISRFRLSASTFGKQSNDREYLGVHDANILYLQRNKIHFDEREIFALAVTALSHYGSSVVPFWYWYKELQGFKKGVLRRFTLTGEDVIRTSAIDAMRLIHEPLPAGERAEYLSSWLATDRGDAVKNAALRYLAALGIEEDYSLIKKELDRNDNQTSASAADALVSIRTREAREKGLAELCLLQPLHVRRSILETLFEPGATYDLEQLHRALDHRCPAVRGCVVTLIRKQHSLAKDLAERLLQDGEADVRFEALQSLLEGGKKYSSSETKEILVRASPTVGMLTAYLDNGEENWSRLRMQQLSALSDTELATLSSASSIYDLDSYWVFQERGLKHNSDELRHAVDDQFQKMFQKELAVIAAQFGEQHDVVSKTRRLRDFLTKEWTRKGVDILCKFGSPLDLARVRKVLKSAAIDFSPFDIDFLGKVGEWQDIPLIAKSLSRPDGRHRRDFTNSKYHLAARAILFIGSERPEELLKVEFSSTLLATLITEMTDKGFKSLSQVSILTLLRSEDERVRKVTALKCCRTWSKRDILTLLEKYSNDGKQYYYNVLHWLDFGVSVPRDRVPRAASSELSAAGIGMRL